MCVEDWNIPQSFEEIVHEVSISGSGTLLELPKNEARALLIILGPTTGTITVRIGPNTNASRFSTITTSQDEGGRVFSLRDYSKLIQGRFVLNASAAMDARVHEYLWVLNPQQRKQLAQTGGF